MGAHYEKRKAIWFGSDSRFGNQYGFLIHMLAICKVLSNELQSPKWVIYDFSHSVVSNFIVTGIWCEVMPDFLENMYVITYYFIGAYICKYRPAPSRIWCAVVALVVLVGETLISFVLSSKEYAWYVSNSFSSLAHAVVAVSIFLLLYQVQVNFKPLRWLVGEIATCSFEMYLLSYFTDSYLYKIIPLSPWQILMINFVVAYIGARLLRCAVAPLGNLLKKGVLHLSENRKSVL